MFSSAMFIVAENLDVRMIPMRTLNLNDKKLTKSGKKFRPLHRRFPLYHSRIPRPVKA
jgi:hypothetical protein